MVFVDKKYFIDKLIKFGSYFSFLFDNPSFIDSYILDAVSVVDSFDEKNFNSLFLSLKRQIKKRINELYDEDRDQLFQRLFLSRLSKRNLTNEMKIKLLSSVISAIDKPIEKEFYKGLLETYNKHDYFLTDFYIRDQDGTLGVNEALLEVYPNLRTVAEEYVSKKIEKKGIIRVNYKSCFFEQRKDEIKKYYERINNGDKSALHEFVMSNINLMYAFINKYIIDPSMYDDLVQVGYLALVDAAEKYNPERGFTFSTYASYKLLVSIKNYVYRNSNIVTFSYFRIREMLFLETLIAEEETKIGRDLNDYEIMDLFSISKEELDYYKMFRSNPIDINAFKYIDDGEFSSEVLIGEEDENFEKLFANMEFSEVLSCIKECLSERELQIFLMRSGYYGNKFSCDYIGKMLGLTRERIRQIESKIYEILMGQEVIYRYIDDDKKTDFEKQLERICDDDYDALCYLRYRLGLNSKRQLSHSSAMAKIKNAKSDVRKRALILLSRYDDLEFVRDKIDTDSNNKFRKRKLNIIDILKDKYSMDEISVILSSLPDEDLRILKERFGEDLSSLFSSNGDVISSTQNILTKKVPFIAEKYGIKEKEKKKKK